MAFAANTAIILNILNQKLIPKVIKQKTAAITLRGAIIDLWGESSPLQPRIPLSTLRGWESWHTYL